MKHFQLSTKTLKKVYNAIDLRYFIDEQEPEISRLLVHLKGLSKKEIKNNIKIIAKSWNKAVELVKDLIWQQIISK